MTDYAEIRRLARGRRISLTDLSESVGLWRGCFSEYEKIGRELPCEKVVAIAAILRVSPTRLIRPE